MILTDEISPLLDNADQPVALALSGGPDSMALCHMLAREAEGKGGPVIHALTIDHALRPESAQEAQTVHAWVRGWPSVTHEILTLPTAPGSKNKTRIMEQARLARYEAMATYCHRYGIAQLFVAHHQDDQAETVLFRLAKGSGLDGLAGMRLRRPLDNDIMLVRPLLSVSKSELIAYCEDHEIPFVKDPTNLDPAYARSRIRQSYDILAKEGLTAKRLAVIAERLGRASDALDYYCRELCDTALRERGQASLAFDYHIFMQAPLEIRIRLIGYAMAALKEAENDADESYGPRLERLEALVTDLSVRGKAFKARTLGGFILSFDPRRELVVLEKEEDLPPKGKNRSQKSQ